MELRNLMEKENSAMEPTLFDFGLLGMTVTKTS